jgi:hypothetical protein
MAAVAVLFSVSQAHMLYYVLNTCRLIAPMDGGRPPGEPQRGRRRRQAALQEKRSPWQIAIASQLDRHFRVQVDRSRSQITHASHHVHISMKQQRCTSSLLRAARLTCLSLMHAPARSSFRRRARTARRRRQAGRPASSTRALYKCQSVQLLNSACLPPCVR